MFQIDGLKFGHLRGRRSFHLESALLLGRYRTIEAQHRLFLPIQGFDNQCTQTIQRDELLSQVLIHLPEIIFTAHNNIPLPTVYCLDCIAFNITKEAKNNIEVCHVFGG